MIVEHLIVVATPLAHARHVETVVRDYYCDVTRQPNEGALAVFWIEDDCDEYAILPLFLLSPGAPMLVCTSFGGSPEFLWASRGDADGVVMAEFYTSFGGDDWRTCPIAIPLARGTANYAACVEALHAATCVDGIRSELLRPEVTQ